MREQFHDEIGGRHALFQDRLLHRRQRRRDERCLGGVVEADDLHHVGDRDALRLQAVERADRHQIVRRDDGVEAPVLSLTERVHALVTGARFVVAASHERGIEGQAEIIERGLVRLEAALPVPAPLGPRDEGDAPRNRGASLDARTPARIPTSSFTRTTAVRASSTPMLTTVERLLFTASCSCRSVLSSVSDSITSARRARVETWPRFSPWNMGAVGKPPANPTAIVPEPRETLECPLDDAQQVRIAESVAQNSDQRRSHGDYSKQRLYARFKVN